MSAINHFLIELITNTSSLPKRIIYSFGCELHHFFDVGDIHDRVAIIFALEDDHQTVEIGLQCLCPLQVNFLEIYLIQQITVINELFRCLRRRLLCSCFSCQSILSCYFMYHVLLTISINLAIYPQCGLFSRWTELLPKILITFDFCKLFEHLVFSCCPLALKKEVELFNVIQLGHVVAIYQEEYPKIE